MRIARSISALIGCAALLAGCGGGGGSTPAAHVAAPTSTATSVPTGSPVATAKLTIKFPATFHTAKKASATARGAATTTRKSPAYVNPDSSAYLDVYVNGVDETTGTNISDTSDGTQTISLPIYSTNSQQIVAVESEGGVSAGYSANVLAIGETDLASNSFQAGDVTQLSLTMLMNAVGAGITSDPSYGSDATVSTSVQYPYYDNVSGCGFPSTGYTMYLFAYDFEDGFISSPGLGVTIPTISAVVQQSGTYPVDSVVPSGYSGLNAGFDIKFAGGNGGLIITALLNNPAAAIYQDAYYNEGAYPGVDSLNQNNSSFYQALQSIGFSTTTTTQIYVDPYLEGC